MMRDKAVRIFRYLRELKRLNAPVVRDLAAYREQPVWVHDIPTGPGVKCAFHESNAEEGTWLEVRKQRLPPVPQPPPDCRTWIRDGKFIDPDSLPVLLDAIDNEPDGRTTKRLVDEPDVCSAFERYLSTQWKPWADRYRVVYPAYALYNRLFEIHAELKKAGEKLELVMGLGLLIWRHKSVHIRRHFVVAPAQLSFDPQNGVISIRPALGSSHAQFEHDFVDDILHRDQVKNAATSLDELGNVCSEAELGPLLNRVTNLLPESNYAPCLEYKRPFTDKPVVSFAPAFILRKRGELAWIKAFDSIITSLEAGGNIPANVAALTDAKHTPGADNGARTGRNGNPSHECVDGRVYFPLVSNDAQRRIVLRTARSDGVLVQGPPGTGKSHTIANLICHYLALGKRMLITSQTPRALKVLKDKIAAGYQGLCVSVLGNDPDSLNNLNEAVQAFNEHYANKPDAVHEKNALNQLGERLDLTRQEIAETQTNLRQLSEFQYREHVFGPYSGNLMQLAQSIAADSRRFDWVPPFTYSEHELPPTQSEVDSFFEATKTMTSERTREISQRTPDEGMLPDETTFEAKVREYTEYKHIIERNRHLIEQQHFVLVRRARKQQLEQAYAALQILGPMLVTLRSHRSRWVAQLRADIWVEADVKWRHLLQETISGLDYVRKIRESEQLLRSELASPNCPDECVLLRETESCLDHIEPSERVKLIWRLLSPSGRRSWGYVSKCTLDGQLMKNRQDIDRLRRYLLIRQRVAELRKIWSEFGQSLPDMLWVAVADLNELAHELGKLLDVVEHLREARMRLGAIDAQLVPDWHDEDTVNRIQELLLLGLQNLVLDASDAWFYSLQRKLQDITDSGNAHRSCQALLQAVCDKSPKHYHKALAAVRALLAEKKRYEWWKAFWSALTDNKRVFFKYIREHVLDADIDAKLLEWEDAWHFSTARAFLDRHLAEDEQDRLQSELKNLQDAEKELIVELGSRKAWFSCMQALKSYEIQYLRAWAQAVKRIGKGTGKWANKHRREAQRALNRCRTAIPAWIMPLYRVVESVTIQPGAFDVVIVDEASQSGPEALILPYLAKQCIVVGDSEQIAPESFADRERVYRLIEELLYDIPHSERYDPETSLYSHAEIRYPETILLNEHFRCMPEIIQFSNNAFYHGRLRCLRQYPPNRLEPLVTVHTKRGYREDGSKVNKYEGDAIVSKILDCCRNPRYEGLSMGVISLVGNDQAKHIDSLLRAQLDPQEMNARNIVCGDAYSFQGDERDVIFLSMVADPNTGTILAKPSDGRRINVAASRAREQMWIFHSFEPKDMSSASFLHKLLTYALEPRREIDPADLESAQKLFESNFEEDVFNAIADRGYHVQPQFVCAGYRIDLVVSGMRGRIAVECDGDIWHGPERLEQDMERQRLLERCGWTFWRIRGSEYYRDPVLAMEPLWRLLEDYGIHPAGKSMAVVVESAAEPDMGETDVPSGAETGTGIQPHSEPTPPRLANAMDYAKARASEHPEFSNDTLRAAILSAMRKCLNHRCARDSIVSRVCQELSIVKRAGPRRLLARHVMLVLDQLVKDQVISENGARREGLRLEEDQSQPNLFDAV